MDGSSTANTGQTSDATNYAAWQQYYEYMSQVNAQGGQTATTEHYNYATQTAGTQPTSYAFTQDPTQQQQAYTQQPATNTANYTVQQQYAQPQSDAYNYSAQYTGYGQQYGVDYSSYSGYGVAAQNLGAAGNDAKQTVVEDDPAPPGVQSDDPSCIPGLSLNPQEKAQQKEQANKQAQQSYTTQLYSTAQPQVDNSWYEQQNAYNYAYQQQWSDPNSYSAQAYQAGQHPLSAMQTSQAPTTYTQHTSLLPGTNATTGSVYEQHLATHQQPANQTLGGVAWQTGATYPTTATYAGNVHVNTVTHIGQEGVQGNVAQAGQRTAQSTGGRQQHKKWGNQTNATRTFVIKPNVPKQSRKTKQAAQQALNSELESPAYIKVAPRDQRQANSSAGIPNAFAAFKQRALVSVFTEEDEKSMEVVVNYLLEEAKRKGTLWSTDWGKRPVPKLSMLSNTGSERKPQKQTHVQNNAKKAAWAQQAAKVEAMFRAKSNEGQASRPVPQPKAKTKSKNRKNWGQDTFNATTQKNYGKKVKRGGKKKEKMQMQIFGSPSSGSSLEAAREERLKRQKRAERFGDGTATGCKDKRKNDNDYDVDLDNFVVKGTCQELEKSYLRLSSVPDPSVVRPEPVLLKALKRLVKLLREKSVTYFYASEQFKGMRQDCTVQRLRNKLAVNIYEAHARAALEYGDLWEYNQCQAQLEEFYSEGLDGCETEFLAYRILYQAFHMKRGEGLCLRSTLRKQSKERAQPEEVVHAWEVVEAMNVMDPIRFFKLYTRAPKLSRALMDERVEIFRFQTVRKFATSYRLNVPVPFMAKILGFIRPANSGENDVHAMEEDADVPLGCMEAFYVGKANMKDTEDDGITACRAWLEAHGAVVKDGNSPSASMFRPQESKTKLFIPQEKNAVAHGDANLSLTDFLTRPLAK